MQNKWTNSLLKVFNQAVQKTVSIMKNSAIIIKINIITNNNNANNSNSSIQLTLASLSGESPVSGQTGVAAWPSDPGPAATLPRGIVALGTDAALLVAVAPHAPSACHVTPVPRL